MRTEKERIRRIAEKTANYTIVSNEVFRRDDLSARAKGLYAYLMTLPNDWIINKKELYTHFTEGRDSINAAFNELREAGYIEQVEIRESGRFKGMEYIVYESLKDREQSSQGELPFTEKPDTEKPDTENPHLLNTNNILNTNNTNTRPDEESIPYNLAKLLLAEHRKIDPEYVKKDREKETLQRWARDIDRLIRLDGRTPEDIEYVIKWCKADDFWKSNIISGRKLREKFPTLYARSRRGSLKTERNGWFEKNRETLKTIIGVKP